MQYSAILRVVVVGGAVVAAAGSATSGQQQQGYYPRQQGASQGYPGYPQGYYAQYQPYGGSEYGGATYATPPAPEPEPAPVPEPEPAPQVAYAEPAPEPAPETTPEKRTQWVCNATGWWQKCESAGYPCYAQSSMMLGFGTNEPAARVSAETLCNTAMSRLMSVNFTYRTSVTQRCKAVSCSPPNSR